MHILESYALSCGAKVDIPYVYEQYLSLPFEKYILFADFRYKHYQEVIDIIYPKLKEKNINIIHLSRIPLKLYNSTYPIKKFNPNQSAYLVRHSLGCFGESSYFTDLASHYGKKLVCLYSNMYINNVKPYWGKPSNTINLESEKGGGKPWFDVEDDLDTINTIKPERIAKGILDNLDLNYDYEYESVFFGDLYNPNDIMIDLVPDEYPPFTVNSENASIRMDLNHDEDFLSRQLALARYDIYSSKPVSKEILIQWRKKIDHFFYIIDEDDDPEFVSFLRDLSIETLLLTYLDDKIVTKKKLRYMDYGPIVNLKVKNMEEIGALKEEDINSLFYSSARILIDKGVIYSSEYAWKNKLASQEADAISKFEDHPTLLKDLPFFKILKKPLDKK